MGFMKVKAPNSHNRKRLAVESRRHASRDDSHMFIIKLPPNLHYYASPNGVRNSLDVPSKTQHPHPHPHLHQMSNSIHDNAHKIAAFLATDPTKGTEPTEASALKTNGKKVNGIPLGYTKDAIATTTTRTTTTMLRTGHNILVASLEPGLVPGQQLTIKIARASAQNKL